MLKDKCPQCGQLLSLSTLAATMMDCAGCQAAFVDPQAQSLALLTRGGEGPPKQTGEVPLTPEFKRRFFLSRVLGSGAMGTVVEGFDKTQDNRKVAIKFLMRLDKDSILERFVREARSLGKAEHPSLMKIFEVGEMGEHPFIVTEYLGGGTLRDKLKRVRVFPLPAAAEIACDILAALGSCHRAGFIHRDIKPENIMFGEDGKARVVDLGLAKEAGGTSLTEDGVALGTPLYMSPEQVTGEQVGTGSDVYSVALVFYEMVVGKHPFIAPSLGQILDHHLRTMPKPIHEAVPGLPPELSALLAECLQKTLDKRLGSADEFARRLAEVAGIKLTVPLGPPIATPPAPARVTAPIPRPARAPAAAPAPAPAPPAKPARSGLAAAPTPATASITVRPPRAAPQPAHVRTQEYGALPSPGAPRVAGWQKAAGIATAAGVLLLMGLQTLGPRGGGGSGPTGTGPRESASSAPPAPPPVSGSGGPAPTATSSGGGSSASTGGSSGTKAPGGRPATSATDPSQSDIDDMQEIKGRTFKMGVSDATAFDAPLHEVTISTFELDRNEVTNARFRRFTEARGYKTDAERGVVTGYVHNGTDLSPAKGATWQNPRGDGVGIDGKDELPVVQVTYDDALQFCAWAGKRLPTEAEWEFAARAGLTSKFGLSDDTAAGAAVCGKAPQDGPQAVHSFQANAWGCFDMLGNVREWCADNYDDKYYKVSPPADPPGPENGSMRVVRGGSWVTPCEDMPLHKRWKLPHTRASNELGFRTARTPSR